jgi:predicted transcriptional regulator
MARPKQEHPTPAELEVLKVLWERGPSTVRGVMDSLAEQGHRRAYTSVMSLMNVMADKGLLKRTPQGRAFIYSPRIDREKTLGRMIGDLWQRAFEGSASTLVSRLLDEASPSRDELDEIRKAIEAYQRDQASGGRKPPEVRERKRP